MRKSRQSKSTALPKSGPGNSEAVSNYMSAAGSVRLQVSSSGLCLTGLLVCHASHVRAVRNAWLLSESSCKRTSGARHSTAEDHAAYLIALTPQRAVLGQQCTRRRFLAVVEKLAQSCISLGAANSKSNGADSTVGSQLQHFVALVRSVLLLNLDRSC